MELTAYRDRFPILAETTYLISHSLGPMPAEAGFDVVSPREPERRGGSVVVRTPDFPAVHAELESRGILCDFRPDAGLRFGPHFFTTDEELELAVTSITEILGRGATLPAPAGTG